MKKWLLVLLILVITVLILAKKGNSGAKTSIKEKISNYVSILAWILITIYSLGFLYWLARDLF